MVGAAQAPGSPCWLAAWQSSLPCSPSWATYAQPSIPQAGWAAQLRAAPLCAFATPLEEHGAIWQCPLELAPAYGARLPAAEPGDQSNGEQELWGASHGSRPLRRGAGSRGCHWPVLGSFGGAVQSCLACPAWGALGHAEVAAWLGE